MSASSFRGNGAIIAVVERMQPLAQWLSAYRPACKVMTLRRRDLDVLRRWPQAASAHEIFTHNNVTYWRGFELRADRSAPASGG